jgi:hypothetical protein
MILYVKDPKNATQNSITSKMPRHKLSEESKGLFYGRCKSGRKK